MINIHEAPESRSQFRFYMEWLVTFIRRKHFCPKIWLELGVYIPNFPSFSHFQTPPSRLWAPGSWCGRRRCQWWRLVAPSVEKSGHGRAWKRSKLRKKWVGHFPSISQKKRFGLIYHPDVSRWLSLCLYRWFYYIQRWLYYIQRWLYRWYRWLMTIV